MTNTTKAAAATVMVAMLMAMGCGGSGANLGAKKGEGEPAGVKAAADKKREQGGYLRSVAGAGNVRAGAPTQIQNPSRASLE